MTSPSARAAAPRGKLILALTAGAFAISFAAPAFRRAAPIDPLLASAVRLALAALLLAPSIPRAQAAGKLGPGAIRAAVLGGLLYAVHFGTWVASLGLTSVAASVTLVTATPLLLAVVGVVRGEDAPTARLWAGLALATIGTAAIGFADLGATPGASLGDALAFVGAIAMAAYLLVVRRAQASIEAVSFSAVAAGVAALVLFATLVARSVAGESLAWPSLESLAWVALTALVSQLVGHTALTWALEHTTPTVVGLTTTAEPVIASALTWVWLGEAPSAAVLAGSAVALVGVVLGLGAGGVREVDPTGETSSSR